VLQPTGTSHVSLVVSSVSLLREGPGMDLLLGQYAPSSSLDAGEGPLRPPRQQQDNLPELAAAHKVFSEAAKKAGSLFKSLQAAIQIEHPAGSSPVAGVWGAFQDQMGGQERDYDPRLPWTPRTEDERCVARCAQLCGWQTGALL